MLFHRLWRQQLRAGRHATGENPFDSIAFLENEFLSGQFPKEAWWSCLDQCQMGLCPPWPGGHLQRHRKRTCFVSSREQSLPLLTKTCGPQCRGIFEHIPLSGGWNGRALTSWAEDYSPELARLLCDALSIEEQDDAFALPGKDDLMDADQDEIMAGNLVDLLMTIEDGSYGPGEFTGSEWDLLETHSGLAVKEIIVTSRPENFEDPPAAPGPYRATILLKDGRWSDMEGSVISSRAPPLQGRLAAGERAVVLYGEPLLRVRARTLPSDATEQVAMAWLRKFHVGTHHATPAEMAQAIRDGGGSRMLVRLALQFKCPICDIDSMPKSHAKSTLPLAARSFT